MQNTSSTEEVHSIQKSTTASLLAIIALLLAIIAAWLVFSTVAEKRSAKKLREQMRITSDRMEELQLYLTMAKIENHVYPRRIQDIEMSQHPEITEDAWGSSIVYSTDGYKYSLRSPGPDKAIGTADDIVLSD